ncbi:MAG: 3-deoxy-7-phosphoheptulonate synthase [Defluviitaleaceae bacterium]|nr:3-deoxy-7-phosphoheptulonate synthase [Defluviitaleaceae bacterium]
MMEILAKLPCVDELKKEAGPSEKIKGQKGAADREIADIINGESDKLLLIVGPCSADDPVAVLEYAHRLAQIAKEVREHLCIVMRVFTAKPRTASMGYMGLIHESDGIAAVRRLHLAVQEQAGLPTADELLYPATLPYFDDIVSYFTIGARSVENQEHRLLASGIAAAVGMKNPISGNLHSMANAIAAAKAPHDFIFNGHYVQSRGNPLAHGILRGGAASNFHAENLMALYEMGQTAAIIDVNHANSGKNHAKQPDIALAALESRRKNPIIKALVKGLMIESYIEDGAAGQGTQAFGQSITDPCLGLAATEKLIYKIAGI